MLWYGESNGLCMASHGKFVHEKKAHAQVLSVDERMAPSHSSTSRQTWRNQRLPFATSGCCSVSSLHFSVPWACALFDKHPPLNHI